MDEKELVKLWKDDIRNQQEPSVAGQFKNLVELIANPPRVTCIPWYAPAGVDRGQSPNVFYDRINFARIEPIETINVTFSYDVFDQS